MGAKDTNQSPEEKMVVGDKQESQNNILPVRAIKMYGGIKVLTTHKIDFR